MPPGEDDKNGGKTPAVPFGLPSTNKASGAEEDPATTIFTLPQFKVADLMPQSSGKLLGALKRQLSNLTVEKAGSGIRHQNGRYVVLPRTLRSAWMAKVKHPVLGPLRFLMGQTRSTWIIVYDMPYERIYEDPRFMGVELKTTDVTTTPKGKKMYVSRVRNEDVVKINAIAAQDAGMKARPDSLAPTEGSFSKDETIFRLKQCKVVHSSDPSFDLESFVSSIQFMTPTQGPSGNYYYLDAGDVTTPKSCELHVDKDPEHPPSTFRYKTILAYKNELSYLYSEIR